VKIKFRKNFFKGITSSTEIEGNEHCSTSTITPPPTTPTSIKTSSNTSTSKTTIKTTRRLEKIIN